jgi:hypothetical protein
MSDGSIPAGHKLITDNDLRILQETYKLMNEVTDHPEYGLPTKRAMKAIRPDLRFPEIDVADPLLKPINEKLSAIEEENKKLREEREADRREREDDKALGDLQSKLTAAQKKHRLTDEAMGEVKKIMAERGVADPDIAAQYVVANIEPAKPVRGSNFGPQEANIFGIDGNSTEDDTKLLHNNNQKWFDGTVDEIMAEFDRQDAA